MWSLSLHFFLCSNTILERPRITPTPQISLKPQQTLSLSNTDVYPHILIPILIRTCSNSADILHLYSGCIFLNNPMLPSDTLFFIVCIPHIGRESPWDQGFLSFLQSLLQLQCLKQCPPHRKGLLIIFTINEWIHLGLQNKSPLFQQFNEKNIPVLDAGILDVHGKKNQKKHEGHTF